MTEHETVPCDGGGRHVKLPCVGCGRHAGGCAYPLNAQDRCSSCRKPLCMDCARRSHDLVSTCGGCRAAAAAVLGAQWRRELALARVAAFLGGLVVGAAALAASTAKFGAWWAP